MSNRLRKAQGEDYGGKTITQRTSGINPDFLSTLEKGMVAASIKQDLKKSKPPKPGSSPREDPGSTGSKVAHFGRHGAPSVYREDPGGRSRMKGKRKSESE